jgi:hypothetical protein
MKRATTRELLLNILKEAQRKGEKKTLRKIHETMQAYDYKGSERALASSIRDLRRPYKRHDNTIERWDLRVIQDIDRNYYYFLGSILPITLAPGATMWAQ